MTIVPTVYVSRYPFECSSTVTCKQRQQEIDSCASNVHKQQKLFSWKLLEQALLDQGVDLDKVTFCKNSNGKWLCNVCYVSISHTDGVVAVGISDVPIGVDVERVTERFNDRLAQRISSCYGSTLDVARSWTGKEATYKMSDNVIFEPSKTEIHNSVKYYQPYSEYCLAVVCEKQANVVVK